jgi:hypothetical protein
MSKSVASTISKLIEAHINTIVIVIIAFVIMIALGMTSMVSKDYPVYVAFSAFFTYACIGLVTRKLPIPGRVSRHALEYGWRAIFFSLSLILIVSVGLGSKVHTIYFYELILSLPIGFVFGCVMYRFLLSLCEGL